MDAADWRLTVEGDAVDRPLELSYDDIRKMPSRTLVSYLECGGNQRAMFDLVNGRAAKGDQWKTGGISNGEWTGVPLRDVLELAGVSGDAVGVLLIGLDTESPEEGFRRVMGIEKAMHPDTLLAYGLNGDDLPKDHGYPLRALAPGWVGSSSIKWLSRIVVTSEQLWTRNNTTSYVLIGDAYPPEGDAPGKVATSQVIKSALALPWPAELPAGSHLIRGYAQSPDGPIKSVEWSAGLRADLVRRNGAGAAGAVLVGAVRVQLGRPTWGARRYDEGDGRSRQHPAGQRAVQREGLPVQRAGAAPYPGYEVEPAAREDRSSLAETAQHGYLRFV